MHGLDCTDSFINLFESAQIAHPDFKIVLLNADKNLVLINGGFIMQSSYDIFLIVVTIILNVHLMLKNQLLKL